MLCMVCLCRSQEPAAYSSDLSILAKEVSSISYSLLNKEISLDSVLTSISTTNFLNNVKGLLKPEEMLKDKWSLEASSFWASGQSAYYFGDGVFSNLRLENQADLLGVPIRIYGDLVLQNDQINTRLSALGVEIDYELLLKKYKNRLVEHNIQEAFQNLSEGKQNLIKEHLGLEAARTVLLSNEYALRKAGLKDRIDSLKETITLSGDSMLLDSLNKYKMVMEKTEARIDSIYKDGLLKWTEVQQAMQSWHNLAEIEQEKIENNLANGGIHMYNDGYKKTFDWRSILLNIKQLKIGTYRMQSSPFDLSSIPLHGGKIAIQRKGYYVEVNYGKEGKQQRQFPDYVRNFRLAGQGRSIFQIKAGIGKVERSHLHLTFTSINIKSSADSASTSFMKKNVLFGLESRYLISEHVFADLTASVSAADFTGQLGTKELLGGLYNPSASIGKNMASLLRFGWKSKKGIAEYAVGYQIVGSNYVTLGNLFLLQNRHAVRVEGKQRFLQNRGQVKITYIKGSANGSSDVNAAVQQDQFSGELSYRLSKTGSRVWASYSPSYYVQSGQGSEDAIYQLNLITIGAQWMMPRTPKGQWMTMLQMTNFSDQSQFGDTSVVTDLLYLMLAPTYASNKYRVTLLFNTGFDKHAVSAVRDFNVDLSQSFLLKKVQLTQGVQLLRRFYGQGLLLGGTGGIQFQLGKGLRASLGGTYFVGLSNAEKNQFYMNSTVSCQF
jgi:hypothetical protein